MSDVHVTAIDLAKRSFQVCGTIGACVDAPGFARRFSDFFGSKALLSVVCQASGRGLRHEVGMQFEEKGPYRFRELCAREAIKNVDASPEGGSGQRADAWNVMRRWQTASFLARSNTILSIMTKVRSPSS